jgi:hypothetical protein
MRGPSVVAETTSEIARVAPLVDRLDREAGGAELESFDRISCAAPAGSGSGAGARVATRKASPKGEVE